MNLNPIGKPRVIEEVSYGLYVWEMPDGKWVGDDQENWLSVPAIKGDAVKMRALADVVRSFGIEEGKPVFLAGHRRINDEEFEEQKQRLKWGLIPDPQDVPAFEEEMRLKKNGRNR